MPNKNDLTGMRINSITVIKENGLSENGYTLWLCRCEVCGREFTVESARLRGPRAKKDCGCTYVASRSSLIGQRFGRLIVVEKVTPKTKHHTQWLCLCDCGKTVIATTPNLRGGKVKSCGCLQNDHARENAILYRDSMGYADDTAADMLVSKKPYANGTSGYRGVSWSKNAHKYTAQIWFKKKKYHLGCFDDPEEAYAAYLKAKATMHEDYLDEIGWIKKEDTDAEK